jgi:hypothetical protein
LLSESDDQGANKAPLDEATEFLVQCLSAGSTPANTVQAEAKEASISLATLRRASYKLGVLKKKGGMNTGWYWSLPNIEGAHIATEDVEDAPFKKPSIFSTFGKEESTFVKHLALSRHQDDDDAEVF